MLLGKRIASATACLFIALAGSALAQQPPAKAPTAKTTGPLAAHLSQSANPHVYPYAYLLSTSVWSTRKIFVCWDNPDPTFAAEMKLVQDAVTESWEKYSALTFVGWGKCAAVNAGIRITISDEGPYTRGLGKNLQTGKGTQSGGMVLNFVFNNWSPSCQAAAMRTMCIRSIAMHEFGHAIGFAHEQNRPDKPGECLKPSQGQDGDKLLTPYDKESIMNYCFDIYQTGIGLSKLDVSAVRQIYGSEDDKLAMK